MGLRPWDRTLIHPRERPLARDLNRNLSDWYRALEETLGAAAQAVDAAGNVDRPDLVVLGDAFRVVAYAGQMYVQVTPGIAFAGVTPNLALARDPSNGQSHLGVDQTAPWVPIVLTQLQRVPVPAADATDPRLDLLEVRVGTPAATSRLTLVDTREVDPFDPATLELRSALRARTATSDVLGQVTVNGSPPGLLNYKTGTRIRYRAGSGAIPAAPAVTEGYFPLADIHVDPGVTEIAGNRIADRRPLGSLRPGNLNWAAFEVQYQPELDAEGNSLPAVVSRVVAPPGVQVTAARVATPGDGRVEVFVLGGAPINAAGAQFLSTVRIADDTTAELRAHVKFSAPTWLRLTPARAATLFDAARCSPTLDLYPRGLGAAYAEAGPFAISSVGTITMDDGAVPGATEAVDIQVVALWRALPT